MHHHLIESFILAIKLEEKYIVEEIYFDDTHHGYSIKIPSQILVRNFISIIKEDNNQYTLSFGAHPIYARTILQSLSVESSQYETVNHIGAEKFFKIKKDTEAIYQILCKFEEVLKKVEKFCQQSFAC